jgi:serine/threonine-protein kinase
VAERVAEALGITLLEAEQQALQARPTESVEAYQYYLRGKYYIFRDYGEANMKIAVRMYEKAVDLDPTFALAYADLSSAHVDMYWHHYDRSEERLALAKQAIDKALQLDPGLPEAHKQLGWYYYHGLLDYEHALEQFAIALKGRPNDHDLVYDIAAVQRRQGKFEQALANFRKASELAPLLAWCPQEAGQVLLMLRRYREAEGCYDRAISLSPDWTNPYRTKAWLYVLWQGSTEKARAVMQTALQHIVSTDPLVVDMLVMLDVYDRDYEAALDRLALMSEDVDHQYGFMPKDLRYAQIYGYMSKEELEQRYYESTRKMLETKVQQQPEDARLRSVLGIAYAGLGRRQEAIREGELAIELMPISKDACRGALWAEDLAQIYVMVGEFDTAIEQLESLLSIPSELSIPLLRLDPVWDPLREHPRFKKLLETKR